MTRDFGRVAVLMGGWSAERAISLRSGEAVLRALRRTNVDAFGIDVCLPLWKSLTGEHFDCAFIVMHGQGGEDGLVQAVLEAMGVPHTGSGFAAAAMGIDKLACKRIWRDAGLPTPDFVELKAGFDADTVVGQLNLPLFVKPVREGSSIGICRVEHADELGEAWRAAGGETTGVFAEQAISDGEYTVGFVGERWLPSIKIETPRVFYDYAAKYEADDTRYLCPSGLSAGHERKLTDLARCGTRMLGIRGWGRVDVLSDDSQDFYLMEVNVVPGMTEHSLVPKAAAQAGMDFEDLVLSILSEAVGDVSSTEAYHVG